MRVLRLTPLLALALAVAACGGSGGRGSHTYVLAAQSEAGKGIDVTIVSPIAIPPHLMTQQGAKIVSHARGPQVCSFAKTVQNPHSSSAFLDGKTVTLKINGPKPVASTVCTLLKKFPFDANRLGGV